MLTDVALEAHCKGGRKPMLVVDGERRRQVGVVIGAHKRKRAVEAWLACLLVGSFNVDRQWVDSECDGERLAA